MDEHGYAKAIRLRSICKHCRGGIQTDPKGRWVHCFVYTVFCHHGKDKADPGTNSVHEEPR